MVDSVDPTTRLEWDTKDIVHNAEYVLESIARGHVPMNSIRNMRDAANRAVEAGLLASKGESH